MFGAQDEIKRNGTPSVIRSENAQFYVGVEPNLIESEYFLFKFNLKNNLSLI